MILFVYAVLFAAGCHAEGGEPVLPPPLPPVKPPVHLIQEVLSEAQKSIYSDKIYKPLKNWPPREIPDLSASENPVWIRGIKTPEETNYIGVLKQVWINAPLAKVASLIEDFESYPKLYEEVKTVKVLERDGNKLTVFWERYSPVFFVANIKYELIYLIDAVSDKKVVYRYQLKKGNSVNTSDGIIVLESDGKVTKQTGLDFYDANFGLAGALARGKIWNESLEGSYKGDLALKFRAEHPDWKVEQINKEIEKMLERFPIAPVQYLEKFAWD